MKVLTMTAWRRPDYFKEVIESLEEAEGIDEYLLLVSIDGGYPDKQEEMMDILQESSLNSEVFPHKTNIGCAGNTGFILKEGFSRAERVIHVEDDTVFHPDALSWFEFNLDKYEHDERIFSVSGYTRDGDSLTGEWEEPNLVGLRDWFHCWGWATWKRVWDEIPMWFGIHWKDGIGNAHEGRQSRGDDFLQYVDMSDKGSWGVPMNHYWRADRMEICPHTSFVQNIGKDDSTWAIEEVWRFKHRTERFRPHIRVSDFDTFFVDDYLEGVSQ